MSVINCKVAELRKNGYNSLEEWLKEENHIYIGREMSFYVKGAHKSKWANPFTLKKYSLEESLRRYEIHLHSSGLINDLEELRGMTLSCWCVTGADKIECHGQILLRLLNNLNSS